MLHKQLLVNVQELVSARETSMTRKKSVLLMLTFSCGLRQTTLGMIPATRDDALRDSGIPGGMRNTRGALCVFLERNNGPKIGPVVCW